MSYFRPQNVRKIATRSVSGLPNSTQNVSRKRGRVKKLQVCPKICLTGGVQSAHLGPKRVQNPPEYGTTGVLKTPEKARRINTTGYLRKSTGWRFESSPVHHFFLPTTSTFISLTVRAEPLPPRS